MALHLCECGTLPDVYTVSMTDSWGDGWNGNVMTVDGFEVAGLITGSEGTANVGGDCPACEDVTIQLMVVLSNQKLDGLYVDADGNVVAEGGAPFSGTACLDLICLSHYYND